MFPISFKELVHLGGVLETLCPLDSPKDIQKRFQVSCIFGLCVCVLSHV